MRRAVLIAAALLGSCAPEAPAVVASGAAVCRIGPDGGPPAGRRADRGIGGTGAPSASTRQADRGMGGTGIVGVVTGFASLCLAGREVAFDDTVPVRMDGGPASSADLRAGQLAAVTATGPDAALRALGIAIRHEVSGPVEGVERDGVLRVAGQRVTVSTQTRIAFPAAALPRPGEWVAVSGLRGPNGTIAATRLDPVAPGTALVHGTLLDAGSTLRIGALEVRPATRQHAAAGREVTASGRYDSGALAAATLVEDALADDPSTYFGNAVSVFVLEGYAMAANGRLQLGRGVGAPASTGIAPFTSRRAVIEFRRGQDGSLRATGLLDSGAAPVGPGWNGPPAGLGYGWPGDAGTFDHGARLPGFGPGPGVVRGGFGAAAGHGGGRVGHGFGGRSGR